MIAEYSQRKIGLNRPPRIFLIVTNSCDSRCLLCEYWSSRPKKFLSHSFVGNHVLQLIHEYRVNVVCITGGEPTLHPQLPQIVKMLKKAGVLISLITNGAQLTEVFEEIKHCVDAYMFPLDASTRSLHYEIRGVDTFEELVSWPEKIKTEAPSARIAFSCVIQKKNIKDLVNIYELASHLQSDAIFFRAPELKTYCFGRQDSIQEESLSSVNLGDEELMVLKENLKKISDLDLKRGKLHQKNEVFEDFIKYFESLQGKKVEFADRICTVPLTNIIIDESQRVYPCFYLPFSIPFNKTGGDIMNNSYLKTIRKKVLEDKQFRKKYCNCCLQFR